MFHTCLCPCQGLQLPALESMDGVEINELDVLDPAGTITSVVEGMAVVKAHELSKPLEIGYVISQPINRHIAVNPVGNQIFSCETCFGVEGFALQRSTYAIFVTVLSSVKLDCWFVAPFYLLGVEQLLGEYKRFLARWLAPSTLCDSLKKRNLSRPSHQILRSSA